MALDLTLTVGIEHAEAKRGLAEIEQGIQRVEGSSARATPAVSKVTQALSQQTAGTNQLATATKGYESTVIRAAQSTGLLNAQQAAAARGFTASASAAGISSAAIAGLAGAAVLAAAAIGGLIRFLYESAKAYAEQSGILEYHQKAIAGIKDAWNDMFVKVGAAIVGSGADLTAFLGRVESGIRGVTNWLVAAIDRAHQFLDVWSSYSKRGVFGVMSDAIYDRFGMATTMDDMPTPQNALRDADGNLTAYGRQQQRLGVMRQVMQNQLDPLVQPTSGAAILAAEKQRAREQEEAAKRLQRLLARNAEIVAKDTVDAYEDVRKAGQRYYEIIRDANEGYAYGVEGLRFRNTIEADYLNSSITKWLKLRETIGLTNVAIVTGLDNVNVPGSVNIGPHGEALLPGKPPTAYEKSWGVLMGGIDRAGDALAHLADVTRNGAVRGVSMLVDTFNNAAKAGQMVVDGVKAGIAGLMNIISGGISAVASVIQATGSGSTARRTLGGAAAGAAIGANPALIALTGGWSIAVGAGVGALVGWLRGRGQGRGMVEDFAESHGGFDALHRELNQLGDEGERLWVRLTQGVGRGNPNEAQAAINAVTIALQNQKTAAEQAGQAQVDAQQKIVDEIKGRLDGLNQEYDRLFESIKNEAPEEVMGVIERETRERMAAIAEERQHVQEELDAANQALAESMNKVAEALDRVTGSLQDLTSREWNVQVRVPGFIAEGEPAPGSFTPSAHTGGYLYGGKVYPFPVMHGGGSVDEFPIIAQSGEYMMSRQAVQRYGRGFMDSINRGTGRGQKVVLQTIVQLERRVLAEAMAEEYVA